MRKQDSFRNNATIFLKHAEGKRVRFQVILCTYWDQMVLAPLKQNGCRKHYKEYQSVFSCSTTMCADSDFAGSCVVPLTSDYNNSPCIYRRVSVIKEEIGGVCPICQHCFIIL